MTRCGKAMSLISFLPSEFFFSSFPLFSREMMCFDLNSWQNPSPPLKSLQQRAWKGSERKILIDKSRAQTNGNIFFTLIFQPPPPPPFFVFFFRTKESEKRRNWKFFCGFCVVACPYFFHPRLCDSFYKFFFFALSAMRCCNKQVNLISIFSSKWKTPLFCLPFAVPPSPSNIVQGKRQSSPSFKNRLRTKTVSQLFSRG